MAYWKRSAPPPLPRARPDAWTVTDLPFEHRSGRLISVCRAVVAGLFLLAVAVDPASASPYGARLLLLLLVYAVLALGLLAATWNDWWRDSRLGLPSHIVDLAFFTALIFLTGGYASPFFGFFVFLVIAAAMRWRTHQALATSLLIALLFLASAWAGDPFSPHDRFDLLRFITRGASVLTLSVMILWFALNQYGTTRERIGVRLLESVASSEPPARDALLFAASRLAAGRALFAWSDLDEPWLDILTFEHGRIAGERVGPELYPELVERAPVQEPFLFECRRRRLLFESGGRLRMVPGIDPFPAAFAQHYRADCGLAVPIRTSRHEGIVILLDVPGLCADHLAVADRVGEQISSAFERAALLGSIEDATAAQARLGLARDLHDGAVQFFAGLALKLRSLKANVADPCITAREVDEIEGELVRQQKDVRTIIDHLRQPVRSNVRSDLGNHLEILARRMETQWDVALVTLCRGPAIAVTPVFRYQLDQIVREAVSNAVRHGAARNVRLTVAREDDWLHIDISDDGRGFAFQGARSDEQLWEKRLGPRSLHERVRTLGGFLAVAASAAGATLNLRLPLDGGTI